jgi:hypothetical protein
MQEYRRQARMNPNLDILAFDSEEAPIAEQGDRRSVQLSVSSVPAEILIALHTKRDPNYASVTGTGTHRNFRNGSCTIFF